MAQEHRVTIDHSVFEDRYIGACTCGTQVYNALTWDDAYNGITTHLHDEGVKDEDIILPEPES